MPPITKNQQAHRNIAQLDEVISFYSKVDPTAFERILLQIDDVNVKIFSDKSGKSNCIYMFNSQKKGGTLLHIPYYGKQIVAFNSLLNRGVDFTAKNNDGQTPLYCAFTRMFPKYFKSWLTFKEILSNPFINSVLEAHIKFSNSDNPCSAHGLSHFHIACAANHIEAVQLFLNGGACVDEQVNIDSPIFSGYTALHFAVRFCSYETTNLLLERGANVQMKTTKGLTPLQLAVQRNWKFIELKNTKKYRAKKLNTFVTKNQELIKIFLENETVEEVDCRGFSKLHAACALNDSLLADRFSNIIDINCAINMKLSIWAGYTPLHFAVHFNIETAKLLLRKGADIAAKDARGITPFDMCMKKYNLKGIHTILSEIIAFKDIKFSDNETRLSNFINTTQSLTSLKKFYEPAPRDLHLPANCPLWSGYDLSHLAVLFSQYQHGNKKKLSIEDFPIIKDCLRFLDITVVQDAHGRTPIHLAFYQNKYNIVDFFFEHQSTITDVVDNDGLSFLHIACYKTNTRIVKILLSKSADVNIVYRGRKLNSTINEGSTPLHIAVAKEKVEIIKILLEYGANANATTTYGMTPIHRVLTFCWSDTNKEIGDLLFSSCDLKNVVSKTGLSYLHVASCIGNEYAVEELLKLGAHVNQVFIFYNTMLNYRGNTRHSFDGQCPLPSRFLKTTPLHFAISANQPKIVELLLQGGADIFSKNYNGISILYENLKESTWKKLGDISVSRYFASLLANDVALRKRVEDDTGITLLHLACYSSNVVQVQNLLNDSQVDVNIQVSARSPIWAKATPLHLLLELFRNEYLVQILNLLLQHGANFMLMDSNGKTPLHIILSRLRWAGQYEHCCHYNRMQAVLLHYLNASRLLMKYYNDFSWNPINEEGISLFHGAGMTSEYTIVEHFLKNGVDVNLPVKYHDDRLSFRTPLQLVLQSRWKNQSESETKSQLRTIDVLLEYGADVNVENENGFTPLLETAQKGPSRELFFQKLFGAGANINHKDLMGKSAVEILLSSNDQVTEEEFLFFINNGFNFNIVNSVNKCGLIPMYHKSRYQSYFETIFKNPSLFIVNNTGRTPIHNLVANAKREISVDEYVNYIEKMVKLGYDIDAQDSEGKTALHTAAAFHNEKAVLGLLFAGADVNVIDTNNQAAITANFKVREEWQRVNGIPRLVPSPIKQNFILHIITMQLCGLEVNSVNTQLIKSLTWKRNFRSHCKQVSKEREIAKSVIIGTGSLTLEDFLSETGAVASRPAMISETDRQAVEEFFKSVYGERFPKLKSVLKFQYRKMLARLPLMEPATESVGRLLGIVNGLSMPELGCRSIIRFLTNTEVKNLIKSTLIDT